MRNVDRILATSDLHGENGKLLRLLKKAAYEPNKDLLVICGDLIDRGEENLNCLATCEELQKNGAVVLKGNHEQFLEQSLHEMLAGDTWRTHPSKHLSNWVNHYGGVSMYHEIKDLSAEKLMSILRFIQSLPPYFATDKFIFSHGGGNPSKPIEANTEDELIWADKSFPYCPAYKDKVMVFGHTPTWRLYPHDVNFKKINAKIWYDTTNKDKLCVDCGSVFGGRLAAIELPTYREFYE